MSLRGYVFVLAGLSGETVQAFGALENLMDLQTVPALAFLDGVFAAALWADWVWLLVLRG